MMAVVARCALLLFLVGSVQGEDGFCYSPTNPQLVCVNGTTYGICDYSCVCQERVETTPQFRWTCEPGTSEPAWFAYFNTNPQDAILDYDVVLRVDQGNVTWSGRASAQPAEAIIAVDQRMFDLTLEGQYRNATNTTKVAFQAGYMPCASDNGPLVRLRDRVSTQGLTSIAVRWIAGLEQVRCCCSH